MTRKLVYGGSGLLIAGFLLLQIIPVGNFFPSLKRDANPPLLTQINWDSTETERMMRAACLDCHSNETVWPWYSHIAPVSWLVTRDVNQGRWAMNFSTETSEQFNMEDMEWHLYNNMPPREYLLLHPEAQMNDEQKAALIAGLRATFGEGGDSGMEGMEMGAPEPATTPETP